ncbi:hypothetical protein [Tessaracoccus coleopterorum]|uniref:hypothetical protein n=1 Tax=Tessaracoccus coleopterorum TaxID=2714950 RepID=UPI001E527F95|nr:hypothetical protein [Tessaracoccus coleopterorum]
MGQERHLCEQHAEHRRDQQLEPAVAEQHEAGDGTAEAERENRAHHDVEPTGAVQEALLLHPLRHFGVGADQRWVVSGVNVALPRANLWSL